MQKELDNNEHKGSIFDWCFENNFQNWLYEFEYYKSKLIAALMYKNENLKTEFCADLGNYLLALMFKQNVEIQKSNTLAENPESKII